MLYIELVSIGLLIYDKRISLSMVTHLHNYFPSNVSRRGRCDFCTWHLYATSPAGDVAEKRQINGAGVIAQRPFGDVAEKR
jgi:hypothetical protein